MTLDIFGEVVGPNVTDRSLVNVAGSDEVAGDELA
jgi:hypothetical protein